MDNTSSPRMTREQLWQAIASPAMVYGTNLTPRLANRLLNDIGDNQDQLPILQHALMRTWEHWQINKRNGEEIDLSHYEAIGGMDKALSLHADEAYNELDTLRKLIAEKLFKCLTEKGTDNREMRRPAKLSEIASVAEAEETEVVAVIDTFRKPGRSFLMPPASEPLNPENLIDISHESLIHNWARLKSWVDEESESAAAYSRLAETAVLYLNEKEDLLHNPGLQIALDWHTKNKPNESWGRRYHPKFDDAMKFLEESKTENKKQIAEKEASHQRELQQAKALAEAQKKRAEDQKKSLKQFRFLTIGLSVIFLLAFFLAIFAFKQQGKAKYLTKNTYWGNFVQAKERNDGVQAAHFLARFGKIETISKYVRNCMLDMHKYTKNLFLKSQVRHENNIGGVLLSRDESLILTWGDDGTARLFAHKGRLACNTPAHEAR